MRLTLLSIFFLAINLTISSGQTKKSTKHKSNKFPSGLYSIIPDKSKRFGIKLENSEEYFAVNKEGAMILNNIDTVYSEFNKQANGYLLTIKFNQTGKKDLLVFSTKNQQQKVGLILNDNLIVAPTMFEPITNGGLTLASSFSKSRIDNIVGQIKKIIH